MNRPVRMFSITAMVLLLILPVFAQIETAKIRGTVSDQSGARVTGAHIEFIHVATNLRLETKSGSDGGYISAPLRIGEYRIVVEAAGFKRFERSGVVLQLEETAVIDVSLQVGQVNEVVKVTAAAPLLETTASQGQVIDNRRIVDMPLNGRDYIQLALLSAGAIQPIDGRFGGYSAAGQRTSQNNYTLDGLDNNNLQIAAQGLRAEVVKPSIDAIQEFKISTNAYSAESGRALGGTVNVSIKSGSNAFHGSAFEFIRNEKLDARNYFDPGDKPPFKRNQFGFSVGGPIKKNKTFFFGDYEGTRIRESATFDETIPTQAQLNGDFSGVPEIIYDPDTYDPLSNTRQPFPGNVIRSDRIDPVAKAASQFFPAPNAEGLTENWRVNSPDIENVDKWDIRVDQVVSPKDNLFVRYSHQFTDAPVPLAFPSGQDGTGSRFKHRGQNLGLAWTHAFSSTLIADVKLGWNRIFTQNLAVADRNLNQEIGLTGVNLDLPGSAFFDISDVHSIGTNSFVPNLIDSQDREVSADISWTRGRHALKFGYAVQFLQSYLNNPQQALGSFGFNGNFTRNPLDDSGGRPIADFLLGIPSRTVISNFVRMNLRAPWNHFYAQDEWRVSPKLTLNLGLRYEMNMPWVEKDNGIANFDIDTNPAQPSFVLAQDGSRASRATVQADLNNLAPRFGFAYQALANTVVRGGYGIFYANYEGTGGAEFMETNPPFHIKSRITTDNITPSILLRDGIPSGILTPENAVDLEFSSFQRNAPWPIAQQWNFNIQQMFGTDTVLEVGYYGAKSNHLGNLYDGNFALPGPGDANDNRRYQSAVWPDTNIVVSPLSLMNRFEFNGNSLFHSLQSRLEKRYSNGFTLLAAYIFARTTGDTDGFSGAGDPWEGSLQNPLDRKAERGLDNQHRKHSFSASVIYELPFGRARRWGSTWRGATNGVLGGWSVASIVSLVSGRPFGLFVDSDPANTGNLNRPNVVPGQDFELPRGERGPDRWFNTDAFVPNNPFEYGNAGRNILIGPGVANWDFAAYKVFTLTEHTALQFRFEAFNFTNTPHFGLPSTQVDGDNFGKITDAGRPRNLQLGLKFVF
jgi:hypothetical protein